MYIRNMEQLYEAAPSVHTSRVGTLGKEGDEGRIEVGHVFFSVSKFFVVCRIRVYLNVLFPDL
jgi:nicotinamide mononucleotide (NMN) deamidase PncC